VQLRRLPPKTLLSYLSIPKRRRALLIPCFTTSTSSLLAGAAFVLPVSHSCASLSDGETQPRRSSSRRLPSPPAARAPAVCRRWPARRPAATGASAYADRLWQGPVVGAQPEPRSQAGRDLAQAPADAAHAVALAADAAREAEATSPGPDQKLRRAATTARAADRRAATRSRRGGGRVVRTRRRATTQPRRRDRQRRQSDRAAAPLSADRLVRRRRRRRRRGRRARGGIRPRHGCRRPQRRRRR